MPYKADGTWTPEDDSVANKVTQITSQQSPLMKQAKTQGLQQANRRGLLNSSMAVGAAQAEAYKTALPIASQDAGQTFQKNLSQQGAKQTSNQSAQDYQQQRGLAEQGFGFQKQLAEQDYQQRSGLLNQEAAATKERLQMEIDSKDRIAQMNIAAADREKAASMVAAMENSYASMFGQIASNTSIGSDTRDRLNEHIGALRDANLSLVEQMWGVDIQWPSAATRPEGTTG